ncbi:hypothetical protein GH714_036788 [Hevea brasiliensis]|uniref:Uncharacterized protein n=1 Tax=Hevea brasiliensis TaxID=3981 RepID=A0A6A6KFZ0_HEVBR|nr:hypothetical protein GH714_036788 [Hevea brasiliensis]
MGHVEINAAEIQHSEPEIPEVIEGHFAQMELPFFSIGGISHPKTMKLQGEVAYCLQLPSTAKIHPVFHVSQLKKVVGNHDVIPSLPTEMAIEELLPILPEAIIARWTVEKDGNSIPQLLIQWQGHPLDEATWLDESNCQGQFPDFSLEEKVAISVRGNDAEKFPPEPKGRKKKNWLVYTRRDKKNLEDKTLNLSTSLLRGNFDTKGQSQYQFVGGNFSNHMTTTTT